MWVMVILLVNPMFCCIYIPCSFVTYLVARVVWVIHVYFNLVNA